MKFQLTEYNCGPASLQNALRHLGVRVGQHRLARAAGTTEDGTDDNQLKAAILSVGHSFDEIRASDGVEAWRLLCYNLEHYGPVLLCVDRWQHWVCAYGVGVDRVCWFDPARYNYNLEENGHHSASRGKLLRRWRAARKDAKEFGVTYYGIVVC